MLRMAVVAVFIAASSQVEIVVNPLAKDIPTLNENSAKPRALSASILAAALADADRMLPQQLIASFHFVRIADFAEAACFVSPAISFNNGELSGHLNWVRSGTKERVDAFYDLPDNVQPDRYFDRTIVDDGVQQICWLTRSNQVLISPSAPAAMPIITAPMDWFVPFGRRSYSWALRNSGLRFEAIDAIDDCIVVRAFDSAESVVPAVEFQLSKKLSNAVVGWRTRAQSAEIQWRRTDDGVIIPDRATMYWNASDHSVGMTWILETESFSLAQAEESVFAPTFKAGSLVTDYVRLDKLGRATVYEVSEDMSLRRLAVAMPDTPLDIRSEMGIGAIATVFVLGVAGFRMWYARSAA